jgi:hypothetical protein
MGIPPNKIYFKDNIEFEEYYDDGILQSYVTREKTNEYKISCFYNSDGFLHNKIKTHYNKNGIPCRREQWDYYNGSVNHFDEIIPIFPGYENIKDMSEKDKERHSEIIQHYLFLDDDKKASFLKLCQPHYNWGFREEKKIKNESELDDDYPF